MSGPTIQNAWSALARTLRRRWWVTLVGAAAAIAVLFGTTGWSWTSLVVAVLIAFFAGVGLIVLKQVLDAIGGTGNAAQAPQQPRRSDSVR